MNNCELCKKIKSEMKKKNLTQSDIAKTIGVNRADISLTLKNLANGKSITTNKLFSLLKAMDKTFTISDK